MIGAEIEVLAKDKYRCAECRKVYPWRWIRRHMVKEHGYRYWKGILYDPTDPLNKEVPTAFRMSNPAEMLEQFEQELKSTPKRKFLKRLQMKRNIKFWGGIS